jgi:hypothetical protein
MPVNYREAIEAYFKRMLKDPDSIRYREVTRPEQGYATTVTGLFVAHESRQLGWTVRATIDAKNSNGGYVGFKTYVFLFRGEKLLSAKAPPPADEMKL